ELVDRIQALAALALKANPPKGNPEDKTKPNPEDKADFDQKNNALLKDFEKKPFDLAWATYGAACEAPPRLEHLLYYLSLLKSKGIPAYRETDALGELARRGGENPADWSPEGAQAYLQMVREAERVEAEKVEAKDARIWPWVQDLFQEANRQRQEGKN